MLSLNEHIEINKVVQLMEGESPTFTDEQLDAAEKYSIKWNHVTGNTSVTLFDNMDQSLGTVDFLDPDIAVAFLEEYFDLDDADKEALESYAWVEAELEPTDNLEGRYDSDANFDARQYATMDEV